MFGEYYHVATRRFCCCLPVRLGVLVLSALSAVISGFTAYGLWYTVADTARKGTVDANMSNLNTWNATVSSNETFTQWENNFNNLALDKEQYYAFMVGGAAATIYCLFSIFGFVGAIIKRRGLVAFYSTALWILLVINLAIGIYNAYSISHRRQTIVNQCIAQVNNPSNTTLSNDENKLSTDVCNTASKAGVVIAIILVVVQWLIQLYACIIVKRYVEQLGEEQGYRQHMAGNRIGKGFEGSTSYYPHQPLGGHEMGPYPYNQPEHSHGNK